MQPFEKMNLTIDQVAVMMKECDQLLDFPKQCKAHEPTVYKTVCQSVKYDIPDSKYQALGGTVTVNKPIIDCVKHWFRMNMIIDEKSPKKY
jgi:hypothetical protein